MGSCLGKRTGAKPQIAANNGAGGGKAQFYAAAAALSSYEAACRLDPDLRSFDATLQARTSRAISALAGGAVEVRSISFDSLREVTACLLDMNQEVVKVVLACKHDVWNTPHLFDLVRDYFDNSLHTLDFCAALERRLRDARDAHLAIHAALHRFAAAAAEDGGDKYARALEELRSFRARGDPFTEDFFEMLRSVHRQQLSMLEKLQRRRRELDRRLRSVKAWRRVSSTIFAAAFAAVLICSVAAAALAAPPVAAALAAAASLPLGSVGKWVDSLWKGYQDALDGRRELVGAMQVGAFVVIKDLDNIRVLVEQLEVQMGSLLRAAEFADQRGEEEAAAVGVAVEEIGRKLGGFMRSIEELAVQADECSRDIRRARTVVLQRIIKYPDS